MVQEKEQLLKQVLQLPPLDRAEFVEVLLSSFEFPSRKSIDALWAKEAEDRLDAYERGDIQAIPAQEVFAKFQGEPIT
jgi:putative addiction module component (TIGR02574 family)